MDERARKLQNIGERILNSSRTELYMNMRFLDLALGGLEYEASQSVSLSATDGFSLFYNPQALADLYCESRNSVNRMYLHIVLHCVLRHIVKYENRIPALWNIACDIAVEAIIDDLNIRVLYRAESLYRREVYRRLNAELKVLTAQGIYSIISRWDKTDIEKTEREFLVDSHEYWYPNPHSKKRLEKCEIKWGKIGEKTETEMEMKAFEMSDDTDCVAAQLRAANRKQYDYKDFLRRFSVLREETSVDNDAFDLTFYTYGMSLYGNMPLIEPPEFREVNKIEDFALVIDTSRSCSGELIRAFLEQTYTILKTSESFFRTVNIHLIQCDDRVRSDTELHSLDEIDQYLEKLEIHGGGGTDFRPAFAYVDELIENSAFKNLRGLVYFTDGFGTYPAHRTKYDTAFVFVHDIGDDDVSVPPWAVKIILTPDEITGLGR